MDPCGYPRSQPLLIAFWRIAATTYKMSLHKPTKMFCNFLHFYFATYIPDLHKEQEPAHIENHHTIEIELGGVYLRIANDANPALVSKAIASLRCVVC